MTYTHAGFDSNPLANPFNTRLGKGGVTHTKHPDRLSVPNQDVSMYGSPEWNSRYRDQASTLEVPNQDIPLGDQLQGNGFVGSSDRLFRLADGTVVDFKTGKILHQVKSKDPMCWGDRSIDAGEIASWNDTTGPSIDDLISRIDAYNGRPNMIPDQNLDQTSIEYWLKAKEEAEKLEASLTDEQKQMIRAFEQHFPKSKLIEESKKRYNMSERKCSNGKCDARAD